MTFHVIIVKYKESQKIDTLKNFLRGESPLECFFVKKDCLLPRPERHLPRPSRSRLFGTRFILRYEMALRTLALTLSTVGN